jgi:nucleotide-binding universal stress UspA family protein
MTPPILVAVDPRRDDPAPLALGLKLARVADAPLLLCATYPTHHVDRVHPELAAALRTDAEEALRRAAEQLRDTPGMPPAVEFRAVATTGSPARALHDLAGAEAPLLMVIGSSSRGRLGRLSPGAVTDRVLHGAPCAVAVAPSGLSLEAASAPLRRVGAAYVDAPDGHAALRTAAAIARAAAAHLRLYLVMRPADLYVTSRPPVNDPFAHDTARRDDAEAELRLGLAAAGDPSASGVTLDGETTEALAAASSDSDLLVCGSRGFGPLRTLILGGTSHGLVRRAACAVLVVPPGTEPALTAAFRTASVTSPVAR